MSIYVTGDTHGAERFGCFGVDGFVNRLKMDSFPEQKKMTKEDYVIICGDFGGVWEYTGESPKEKYNLDWLETRSFSTLFVPGNHENYDRLTGIREPELLDSWIFKGVSEKQKDKILHGYPQKSWHGGMVRELRPSVRMLERGYVFEINGCKCFAFGGARSHDIDDGIINAGKFQSKKMAQQEIKKWNAQEKSFRVDHISWWEQEMPGSEEMERGIAMLEVEKNAVDFIFSHDCPASDKTYLAPETLPDDLNQYLEKIKQSVSYKKWFFGHYHENRSLPGGKDFLLYEQILRIR